MYKFMNRPTAYLRYTEIQFQNSDDKFKLWTTFHVSWIIFYNIKIYFTFSELQFVNLKFISQVVPLFAIQFMFSETQFIIL